MGGDIVQADVHQVVDGGTESDNARDVRGASFEFEGHMVVDRFFEGDREDHVAAAFEGGHFFEEFGFGVERADAGWAAHFMGGDGQEIAVEILDIDAQVRPGLSGVEHDDGTDLVGHFDDLLDRLAASRLILFGKTEIVWLPSQVRGGIREIIFAEFAKGERGSPVVMTLVISTVIAGAGLTAIGLFLAARNDEKNMLSFGVGQQELITESAYYRSRAQIYIDEAVAGGGIRR